MSSASVINIKQNRRYGIVFFSVFAESASSVKTKCIQVDFGGGLEIYDTIASELAGLEIGVLGTAAAFRLASTVICGCGYAVITAHTLHEHSDDRRF